MKTNLKFSSSHFFQNLYTCIPEIEPARGIQEYTYQHHLCEDNNHAILDAVTDAVQAEDIHKMLLTAGCGSGKTFMCLTALASWAYQNCYSLILAVPNTLTAEQNAIYSYDDGSGIRRNVIPVTGAKQNRIDYGRPGAYCAVYDKADGMPAFLSEQDCARLGRTILIIDEAQETQNAKTYRASAICSLCRLADCIAFNGGTVIYMTGTPRKISGRQYDVVINCVKVDRNGNEVPVTAFDHLSVCYASDEKKPFFGKLIAEIREKVDAGRRAVVFYNNKRQAAKAAAYFRSIGISASVLSAENKGYVIVNGTEVYRSRHYEELIKNATLSDFRVLFVTSVLNNGTSITGISDATSEEDRSRLVMMYVAGSPDATDMDMMEQFFARARFPYEEAEILFPPCIDLFPGMKARSIFDEIKDKTGSIAAQADGINDKNAHRRPDDLDAMERQAFSRDERACFDSAVDQKSNRTIYSINYENTVALAVREYDRKAYFMPSNAKTIIGAAFGIGPSEILDCGSTGAAAAAIKIPKGDFTKESAELLKHCILDNRSFETSLYNPEAAKNDNEFKRLEAATLFLTNGIAVFGSTFIDDMRRLAGTYDLGMAYQLEIAMQSAGSKTIKMQDGSKIRPFDKVIEHGFELLQNAPELRAENFINAINPRFGHKMRHEDSGYYLQSIFEHVLGKYQGHEKDYATLNYLVNEDGKDKFRQFLSCLANHAISGRWKDRCQYAIDHDLDGLRFAKIQADFMFWNHVFEDDGYYHLRLHSESSLTQAVFAVFRNLEYYVPPYDPAKNKKECNCGDKKLTFTGLRWETGSDGQIDRAGRKNKKSVRITENHIKWLEYLFRNDIPRRDHPVYKWLKPKVREKMKFDQKKIALFFRAIYITETDEYGTMTIRGTRRVVHVNKVKNMIDRDIPLAIDITVEYVPELAACGIKPDPSGMIYNAIHGIGRCLIGPDADRTAPGFEQKAIMAGIDPEKAMHYVLQIDHPAEFFRDGRHEDIRILFSLFGRL